MKEQEMYYGFSKEVQAEYEKQLLEHFGDKVKASIEESHSNIKNWSKSDWDLSGKEFEEICKDLTTMIKKHLKSNSTEVQKIIRRHYVWLKKFWTPTKELYSEHGKFIVESDLRKTYEAYHPQLPKFIAEAIQIFAERELNE